MEVIQRAAETGKVDFVAVVNMEMLFSETVRWMLRLSADEANKSYIENLNKLLETVLQAQNEATAPAPMPQMPPAPVENIPPAMPV